MGYLKKGNFFEFFVKDSGSGIRLGKKEIIFELFRQGSEALTRNYEGVGLGLSISKAYIRMLGGEIWVENNAERNVNASGSTFFFTIPVCPPLRVTSFIPVTMKGNRPADFGTPEKKEKVFYHE